MPELARLIHQFGSSQQVPTIKYVPFAQLFNWLKDSHCSLAPTFPASTDQGLLPFFSLIATKPISDTALQQLQKLPGVEGAYSKPDDALPGLP